MGRSRLPRDARRVGGRGTTRPPTLRASLGAAGTSGRRPSPTARSLAAPRLTWPPGAPLLRAFPQRLLRPAAAGSFRSGVARRVARPPLRRGAPTSPPNRHRHPGAGLPGRVRRRRRPRSLARSLPQPPTSASPQAAHAHSPRANATHRLRPSVRASQPLPPASEPAASPAAAAAAAAAHCAKHACAAPRRPTKRPCHGRAGALARSAALRPRTARARSAFRARPAHSAPKPRPSPGAARHRACAPAVSALPPAPGSAVRLRASRARPLPSRRPAEENASLSTRMRLALSLPGFRGVPERRTARHQARPL